MKKLIQVLCSVFFATTMSLPVDALANSVEDRTDTMEEQMAEPSEPDSYHLVLVAGDFGLQPIHSEKPAQFGLPLIYITDPMGKMVKNAQIVTTIISPDGDQLMNRAIPFRGGYIVFTNHLLAGRYRVEAEVVTDGLLLTREFNFVNT